HKKMSLTTGGSKCKRLRCRPKSGEPMDRRVHFDFVWEFSVRALEQVTHEEEHVEKSTHAVVSKQDARGELESEIHRRSRQLKIEPKGDPGPPVDVARTEAIGIVAAKPRTEADDPSHSQIQIKSEIGFVFQHLCNTPFVISVKSKSGSASNGEVKSVRSAEPVFGIDAQGAAEHEAEAPTFFMRDGLCPAKRSTEKETCRTQEQADPCCGFGRVVPHES